ncbi:MAG: bifunctional UDP-sugar hydrolase/5'-nucleotidase [Myxococcales bacterium]
MTAELRGGRRTSLVSATAALLALVTLSACASTPPPKSVVAEPNVAIERLPRRVTLSVVSTNDLHGRLHTLPRIGGFVANLRRARAADGGGVILLDGGDTFQGELASNLNEGAAVVDAYNLLGYSAAAIGNHEFDFGPVGPSTLARAGENPRGALIARAAQAKYPVLSSNLVDAATGQAFSAPNIVPSTLLDVAGVRVGLIGALTMETPQSVLASLFEGLKLNPLLPSVTREAESLRARGATVVIVVAHAGGQCTSLDNPDDLSSCRGDSEIFSLAKGLSVGLVDAIVAGHTHQRLAHRVNGIPIIEAGEHGQALARVDLTVDAETGRVIRDQLHIPVDVCPRKDEHGACDAVSYEDAPVVDDARVSAPVDAALAAVDQLREEKLGVTLTAPFTRPRGGESALSNLVADLMRKARPQADVTLVHAGALRADLPAGPLRYGSLFEMYPRDSTFAVATLTGAQLTEALVGILTGINGSFVSISGVRATARCEGERLVVSLRRENGRPIGSNESLRVATNNVLATGAKGPLAGRPWSVEDGPPIREELARLLRKQGGSLSATDPALFNPAKPRVSLPSPAPLLCPTQGGPVPVSEGEDARPIPSEKVAAGG